MAAEGLASRPSSSCNQDNDFLLVKGQDTIDGGGTNTIVGGLDSSDGADSISAGPGDDLKEASGGVFN